jgi:hypothetical protein
VRGVELEPSADEVDPEAPSLAALGPGHQHLVQPADDVVARQEQQCWPEWKPLEGFGRGLGYWDADQVEKHDSRLGLHRHKQRGISESHTSSAAADRNG